MKPQTSVRVVRLFGVVLILATACMSFYFDELARRGMTVASIRLTVGVSIVLLAVSVRMCVFGASVGKRFAMAFLLSLLVSVMIGVLPAIVSALGHGVSSDFWMGLFFMVVEAVIPCVVLSLILSVIPIFDRRLADRLKPTA